MFNTNKKQNEEENINHLDMIDDIEGIDGEGISLKEIKKLESEKRRKQKKYLQYSKIILGICVALILFIWYAATYRNYLILNNKDTKLSDKEIETINSFKDFKKQGGELLCDGFTSFIGCPIGKIIGFNDPKTTTNDNLSINTKSNILKNEVSNYISSNQYSYIEKNDNLKKFVSSGLNGINNNISSIKKIEREIGQYGFLPEEIYYTIEDNNIQKSFLSIETIKLYTALKTFSYLDSFISELSEFVGRNPNDLIKYINFYLDNGEKDVENYLTYCQLNPFEWDNNKEKCVKFNDFKKYISKNYSCSKDNPDCKEVNFNDNLFKNIMSFIEMKLDSETFPILSIVLNSLDPRNDTISFNIDINTYGDDEKSLLRKNKLNPNVFIATSLINSLRKSHMIVGDSINISRFEVKTRNVKEVGNEFQVNSSQFRFTIPIQKSVEKEIYDYVYKK